MGIWDDYVAVANWATNRPVIADGAPPTAEQWRVTQEDIYDRLEHLKEGGTTVRTLTRNSSIADMVFNQAQWQFETTEDCISQISAGNNQYIYCRVDLPHGSTVTEVVAKIDPAAHGALPANMPIVGLYRRNHSSPGFAAPGSLVFDATDPSASTAVYDAAHEFAATGSHFVNRESYAYFVRFKGEWGANSVNQLRVYGFTVEFSTPAAFDGGAS
jgi:hypothetical protein